MVAGRLTADCQDAHFHLETDAFLAENEKKYENNDTFSSENEADQK